MSITTRDVALSAADHDFRLRVYPAPKPTGAVLVWLHGGSFMFGSLDMPEGDAVARMMAELGTTVLSVEYTLAPLDAMSVFSAPPEADEKAIEAFFAEVAAAGPRAPFPVASLQTVAAFDWAVEHVAELGGDGRVALGGASAGATLSAGAALRLRDRGGQQPAAVLLAYPLVHQVLPDADEELAGMVKGLPEMFQLSPEVIRTVNVNYVGDAALLDDPYAFAAGHDLRGLPPVVIVNADADALRSSGEGFAAELAVSGVDVVLRRERGTVHGFLNEVGHPAAADAVGVFTRQLDATR